jgi:hypothetical protein
MRPKTDLSNVPCSNCGNLGIYCKGLCKNCYTKAYRSTPKGKEGLKNYNLIKGKEAVKRFKDKQPKKEKFSLICKCGKIAMAKGLCFNCYHRSYERKRDKSKVKAHEIKKEESKWIEITDPIQAKFPHLRLFRRNPDFNNLKKNYEQEEKVG